MNTMKPSALKTAYTRLSYLDKGMGIVGLLIITLALAWRLEWDILPSLGIVAGLSVIVHILLQHTSLAANTLVIILQLLFAPATITAYSLVVGGDPVVAYLSNAVLVLLGSLVSFIVATRLPRGRLWLNVLIAFALLNVGGLIIISLFGFKAGASVGVALAWVYLFVRFLPWHRWLRKVDEIQQTSLPLLSDKSLDRVISMVNGTVFDSLAIETPLQRVVLTDNGLYAISGIRPGNQLKLVEGRLRYKNAYMEEHLARMLEAAENLSFSVKIDYSSIDVVLLVDHAHLPTGTQRFFVEVQGISRTKAISGRVVVCTPEGLKKYDSSKSTGEPVLSAKQKERLAAILG